MSTIKSKRDKVSRADLKERSSKEKMGKEPYRPSYTGDYRSGLKGSNAPDAFEAKEEADRLEKKDKKKNRNYDDAVRKQGDKAYGGVPFSRQSLDDGKTKTGKDLAADASNDSFDDDDRYLDKTYGEDWYDEEAELKPTPAYDRGADKPEKKSSTS